MAEYVCGATCALEENMSLLDESFESCCIMDKTTEKDGYGGVVTVWKDGAPVECAIIPDGGVEQLTAMQRGWTGSYTVGTRKSVVFQNGDVFKRLSDGKTFRVKSDGTDTKTPGSASIDLRWVKAEEVTL